MILSNCGEKKARKPQAAKTSTVWWAAADIGTFSRVPLLTHRRSLLFPSSIPIKFPNSLLTFHIPPSAVDVPHPPTYKGIATVTMAVESVSLQERLERWAQRLQNLTVSPLTRDYPDNQKQELPKRAIEAFESIQLSKETQSDLQKISGSSSGFTVFLTAFIVLVARLTGDEDIAVGTSSSDDGRPFVLRVPIEASETFLQLYTKVQKV